MRKEHDSFYDSAKWKRVRARILRRDAYSDQLSKRYSLIPLEASMVHHIFPREQFPEWQYESWNLISLNDKTHRKLHDKTNNKLTEQGYELLLRTSRANHIDLDSIQERLDAICPHRNMWKK